MAPRPRVEQPRDKIPPSKRGYRVVYFTEGQKEALRRGAAEAGEPTIADYVMKLHRAAQERQTQA